MPRGFILQNSPQHHEGFEVFFERCLEALENESLTPPWVFLRGDGVYQGLAGQRLDEPGFTVPIDGGWRALSARGVKLYVSQRCATLRGLGTTEQFVPGAQLADLEKLAELCLNAAEVEIL